MENKETIVDKILQYWRIMMVKKNITSQGIVCDLGCGFNGVFLKKISPIVEKGIGFDMAVKEEEIGNIVFKKINLNEKIPLENNSCNFVTSLAVIEHVDDYRYFSREIFRILKPGGKCILTTPAPKTKVVWEILMKWGIINQSEDIHEHKNYFSGQELINLFKEENFSEVNWKKFQLGFNNLIIAKK